MAKQKISASELLEDIRAGTNNQSLMQKYKISESGLHSLFAKLLDAGKISQMEFDKRTSLLGKTETVNVNSGGDSSSALREFITGEIVAGEERSNAIKKAEDMGFDKAEANETWDSCDRDYEQLLQALYQVVLQEMKAGSDHETIVRKLESEGVHQDTIRIVMENATRTMASIVQETQPATTGSLVAATLGGTLAALAGGWLWGLLASGTGYTIGYMAVGIGILTGFAVALCARGRRSAIFQSIAMFSSVLGILAGKYMTLFYFLKAAVEKRSGVEVAANVSLFSTKVLGVIVAGLPNFVSPYDVLWLALALAAAWRVSRPITQQ